MCAKFSHQIDKFNGNCANLALLHVCVCGCVCVWVLLSTAKGAEKRSVEQSVGKLAALQVTPRQRSYLQIAKKYQYKKRLKIYIYIY